MIHILTSGSLARDPKAETSKAGKPYANALLRVGEGQAMLFISIQAFDEAADTLPSLATGDACAAQGRLDVGVYEARDGTHKPSLSVMVNTLMPQCRNKPKPPAEPAPQDSRSRPQCCAGAWSAASGDPSDDIRF